MIDIEEVKQSVISVRIDNSLLKRVDASLPLAGARSRNDFVNKAIQFYNVYLQLEGEPDVFSKIVGNIVESKMNYVVSQTEIDRKNDVDRLARNLFKTATELAKLGFIIGDNLKIPEDQMTALHVRALEEVRTTNGILGFEDRDFNTT